MRYIHYQKCKQTRIQQNPIPSLAGLGVDVRVVVDVVTEVIGEELVLDEEMLRLILVHVVVTES